MTTKADVLQTVETTSGNVDRLIAQPMPASSIPMPKLTAAYPQGAHLIKPGDNIQAALDQFGTCRLANSNYGAQDFTMRSDYWLFGLPATDLGGSNITVEPGTMGMVLSGVSGMSMTFPPGNALTQGCVIKRIFNSQITVQVGANIDSNLFMRLINSQFDADGIWTNNRFIFHKQQSNPLPMGTLSSTPARASINNVDVGRTFQSAYGGGYVMSNLGEYAVVGFDSEDFKASLFQSVGCAALRIFLPNGGTGNAGAIGFTSGNDSLEIMGGGIGGLAQGIVAQGLGDLLQVDNGLPVSGKPGVSIDLLGALSAVQQTALAALLTPVRVGSPWEKPSFAPVIDPLGPNWRSTIPVVHADATAMIQNGIDANGIFMLPAGTYYVDAGGIQIGNGQGVVGAGKGKTIIVNTGNNDTFQPDIGISQPGHGTAATGSIHLMDLTMYGGAGQLHFHVAGDQPTDCMISFVSFLYAQTAGMWVDEIYGMDNNFFDNLDYLGCGTGFLQHPDPNYPGSGETPTMAYVDKTMHYNCQFIGSPIIMPAARADNLDSFVNCLIQGSSSTFSGHNALMMANCVLQGSPINSQQIYLAGVVTDADSPISGAVDAEGCSFAAPFAQGGYFMQCKSTAKYGAQNGTLINSTFADVTQMVVSIVGGKQTVLLPATAKPAGQLLFGSVMA